MRPDDRSALDFMPEINSLDRDFKDFRDTAAALQCLDLLITVDTSVAHLAGSLGVKTWLLLPFYGTDWRWQRERTDSPWYPSMRLIRQQKRGDWDYVLNKVSKELAALAVEKQAA
jgi:ADP-heptose:LPS heptosyltransferase